ncbi:MAG: hypothetical protein IJ501_06570 [Bacilli bacterium]|nr:hypothetical protein [Bacilli bacterium]
MEKNNRSDKKINAKDLLQLLSSQWATTEDVMKIGGVGRDKALDIKNEIKENLEEQGYRMARKLVPMEEVVRYFKININYLKKISGEK